MRLERAATAEDAARRAAALIAAAARDAVAERGRFAVALSGGRTPGLMCEALGDEDVPWDATRVLQVDERIAPEGDAQRNLTQLEARLPAPARPRLEPMPVADEDLEGAAAEYGESLPDALDLVHLGLGVDGHTASLVPGDGVLDVADRGVALTAGAYQGVRRMTMTYPYLAAARQALWLVTGAAKNQALHLLLAGDRSIPAGRLAAPHALVVVDDAAAGAKPPGKQSVPASAGD